jgi:hypothetical protein
MWAQRSLRVAEAKAPPHVLSLRSHSGVRLEITPHCVPSLFIYVLPMQLQSTCNVPSPGARCTPFLSYTAATTAALTLRPQWTPPGSPMETPREARLCAGVMWHLPHDQSHMYIITAGVGTEEAAFFSHSHFSLSGQGCLRALGLQLCTATLLLDRSPAPGATLGPHRLQTCP